MKKLSLPVMLLFMVAAMFGCEMNENELAKGQLDVNSFDKSSTTFSSARLMGGDICGDEVIMALTAGQHMDVGSLTVYNDEDNIYIDYELSADNYSFGTLHLWVGADLSEAPKNKQGIFVPGQFPYKVYVDGSSYTFTLPMADYGECKDEIVILAHAEVNITNEDGTVDSETAWGGDNKGTDSKRWYFWAEYTIQCCDNDPEDPKKEGCETAFAFGENLATCFLDIDDEDSSFKRWGWTNYIAEAGSYSFDLYAGAGQCDLSKGTNVGVVSIDYDGENATVTITMNDGFTLDETHYYIGTEILPRNKGSYTVAPGQYPEVRDLDDESSDSYSVEINGPIYVVVHAVACGEYETE